MGNDFMMLYLLIRDDSLLNLFNYIYMDKILELLSIIILIMVGLVVLKKVVGGTSKIENFEDKKQEQTKALGRGQSFSDIKVCNLTNYGEIEHSTNYANQLITIITDESIDINSTDESMDNYFMLDMVELNTKQAAILKKIYVSNREMLCENIGDANMKKKCKEFLDPFELSKLARTHAICKKLLFCGKYRSLLESKNPSDTEDLNLAKGVLNLYARSVDINNYMTLYDTNNYRALDEKKPAAIFRNFLNEFITEINKSAHFNLPKTEDDYTKAAKEMNERSNDPVPNMDYITTEIYNFETPEELHRYGGYVYKALVEVLTNSNMLENTKHKLLLDTELYFESLYITFLLANKSKSLTLSPNFVNSVFNKIIAENRINNFVDEEILITLNNDMSEAIETGPEIKK
jgi:hypothetical protein